MVRARIGHENFTGGLRVPPEPSEEWGVKGILFPYTIDYIARRR